MKKNLLPLTMGGFGIGMTEFVMMGILPDLARTLDISIPVAGHLISAYALGVVLGAPLLVAIAGNYPPKKILLGLMAMFTVFNLLSSFAPSYEIMLITRLLSGLPHGAFFGVGAVVASRLAAKGKEAQSISMMFAGLTVANIVGVPLGTYIGHELSWRLTFVVIGVVGLITLAGIYKLLPDMPVVGQTNLRKDLKLFTYAEPWLILGITAIGTGGLFAWFSYIAPLLTEVAHFRADQITWILVLAGIGMAVGNLLSGMVADRVSPIKATMLFLGLMAVSLIVVYYVSPFKLPILAMTFVTGAISFSLGAPIQILMIRASNGSEMLASSVTQAGFNIGNALGAFLGGLPIAAGLGYASPQWVGAGLATAGLLLGVVLYIRQQNVSSPTVDVDMPEEVLA
ncbi:DHA1 family arabinose polymer transporter-like MFS transporter [Spirosoma oryzae]|uniref:DHA1 family arabinose polymer transporter-like MFS transporter n=1 Tax=Spirosoma oryzae TaxID=1469603 RepID=A0A2T0SQ06_9BACT|nr:MFS transporter [Spirosoma oryzae]PRY35501.1 DHA1 family arabinose polymer transporter-like MFS transporter [Spirosoma oryzae]